MAIFGLVAVHDRIYKRNIFYLQSPFLSLVNILAYMGFYLSKIFDIQLLK